MANKKSLYSGKFDIDKLIFYHEKEAYMGHFEDNAPREIFHTKAINLLKQLKEQQHE